MATVSVHYYYDRIGLDCHTDGEVCERGYYVPGGWHYGRHQCETCSPDCGPYPETLADIEACKSEVEARSAIDDVLSTIGGAEEVQLREYPSRGEASIMVYGVDNCADFDDPFHEYRQAAVTGDIRLLRVIAARLKGK